MFDELDRLRAGEKLLDLLKHYAGLGEADREIWQDRLMERGKTSAEELVRLHGELLAFEWIEQNSGILVNLRDGKVPCCYRVTATGLRALERARSHDENDEAYQSKAA